MRIYLQSSARPGSYVDLTDPLDPELASLTWRVGVVDDLVYATHEGKTVLLSHLLGREVTVKCDPLDPEDVDVQRAVALINLDIDTFLNLGTRFGSPICPELFRRRWVEDNPSLRGWDIFRNKVMLALARHLRNLSDDDLGLNSSGTRALISHAVTSTLGESLSDDLPRTPDSLCEREIGIKPRMAEKTRLAALVRRDFPTFFAGGLQPVPAASVFSSKYKWRAWRRGTQNALSRTLKASNLSPETSRALRDCVRESMKRP